MSIKSHDILKNSKKQTKTYINLNKIIEKEEKKETMIAIGMLIMIAFIIFFIYTSWINLQLGWANTLEKTITNKLIYVLPTATLLAIFLIPLIRKIMYFFACAPFYVRMRYRKKMHLRKWRKIQTKRVIIYFIISFIISELLLTIFI